MTAKFHCRPGRLPSQQPGWRNLPVEGSGASKGQNFWAKIFLAFVLGVLLGGLL